MPEAITVSQAVEGEQGAEPVYNYKLTEKERDEIDCAMTKALGLCHEIDGYCPRGRQKGSVSQLGVLSPEQRARLMTVINSRHQ